MNAVRLCVGPSRLIASEGYSARRRDKLLALQLAFRHGAHDVVHHTLEAAGQLGREADTGRFVVRPALDGLQHLQHGGSDR